jgi:hypothetical protein
MEVLKNLIGFNVTISDVTVMLNAWVAWPLIVVNSYVYYSFFKSRGKGK